MVTPLLLQLILVRDRGRFLQTILAPVGDTRSLIGCLGPLLLAPYKEPGPGGLLCPLLWLQGDYK